MLWNTQETKVISTHNLLFSDSSASEENTYGLDTSDENSRRSSHTGITPTRTKTQKHTKDILTTGQLHAWNITDYTFNKWKTQTQGRKTKQSTWFRSTADNLLVLFKNVCQCRRTYDVNIFSVSLLALQTINIQLSVNTTVKELPLLLFILNHCSTLPTSFHIPNKNTIHYKQGWTKQRETKRAEFSSLFYI